MPECEVCFEEVGRVYTCKNCETVFCDECGDPKRKLCIFCLEEEEEGEEEEEFL